MNRVKAIFESQNESPYWLTRFCFQRALAFIYLIGFLIVLHQYLPLLGERGLMPVQLFLKRVDFWNFPSLFWIHASDPFLLTMGWIGFGLAVLALLGASDSFNIWISASVWGLLWLIYLSFVNVGQTFYSFGWESILLEAGFLAIFLGPSRAKPPKVIIWLYRWVLFRVMFGAGLIKLRADPCWLDLTCMVYHYETQPVPNPLSWYFHWLPELFHKFEVLFTHFVELIVPWAYFFFQPIVAIAGVVTLLFQTILIFSGNLSFLNYMTIVLCIPCFDDRILSRLIPIPIPTPPPMSALRKTVLTVLTMFILFLSINPALNMASSRQAMNRSFDPLHLVNTYGAFGSVTRKRNEVVIQGTKDESITPATKWVDYEFKCKPGDVTQAPCLMSPYHYRLDWQIWFAAMSSYTSHPWVLNLAAKLLKNDPATLSLIKDNPFEERPPAHIRAILYHYRFTTPEERAESGHWWSRRYGWDYLPPLSLKNAKFIQILRDQGWWEPER